MRFSYIGCRCGCHCSLVTERNGLIDHVAEQVPGPVRRDNRVEIGRRKGREGCRGLVEDGNEQVCQACNKRGVFKVFTDFADQGKLPKPGCGHAQRVVKREEGICRGNVV